MSENFIRLIPADPEYVPTEHAQERIRDVIAAVVPGDHPGFIMKITEEVEFIDQGQLFDHVACPECGARYAESAAVHGWWHEVMDKAYETRFRDLMVVMPCCGASLSLNDLRYEMSAGFARFVLQFGGEWYWTIEEIFTRLEEAAGCRLRRIQVRY